MKWIYLVGRILFGMIFVASGVMNHFVNVEGAAGMAAAQGVPFPTIAVIVSGVVIVIGGLSIWLGYMMEVGTWMLAIFLLLAGFLMHDFWMVEDATMQAMQMAAFMKNLSMAGGAMILFYMVRTHGYGPMALGKPMGGSAGTAAPEAPSAPHTPSTPQTPGQPGGGGSDF